MSMNSFAFVFAETKINILLLIFTNCQTKQSQSPMNLQPNCQCEPNKKSDEFLTKLSTYTKSSLDDYAVVSPAGAQRPSGLATGGGFHYGLDESGSGCSTLKCRTSHTPACAKPPVSSRHFALFYSSKFNICRVVAKIIGISASWSSKLNANLYADISFSTNGAKRKYSFLIDSLVIKCFFG